MRFHSRTPFRITGRLVIRAALLLGLAFCLTSGLVFSLSGQPAGGSNAGETMDKVERLDPEVLAGMSREERRAARRAFRAEREAAAQRAGVVQDEPGYRALPEPRAVSAPDAPVAKVAGTTIQYDSGTVTGFFTAVDSSRSLVNRYESALNGAGTAIVPVENTGSITMISFEMLRTSINAGYWSLYSDVMGTMAVQKTSAAVNYGVGLNTHTIDTMVTNNTYMNGSFLAGIFQFNTMFTRVGVDTNSAGGQGFHLFTLNDPATAFPNSGTGLMAAGNRNLVFRVTGNVVTPVELMDFSITDAPVSKTPERDND